MVDLTTLARPGTISNLQGLSPEELKLCADYLKGIPSSIVGDYSKKGSTHKKTISFQKLEAQIINLLARRPCSLEDLADSLGVSVEEASHVISSLKERHRLLIHDINGKLFYSLASALP
jgi:biotin operon repressor